MTNEEAIRMLVRIKERINFEVTDAQGKVDALNMAIEALGQKEKPGHWEYVPFDNNPNFGKFHCSECDRITYFEYDFCPNCGARMVSE